MMAIIVNKNRTVRTGAIPADRRERASPNGPSRVEHVHQADGSKASAAER